MTRSKDKTDLIVIAYRSGALGIFEFDGEKFIQKIHTKINMGEILWIKMRVLNQYIVIQKNLIKMIIYKYDESTCTITKLNNIKNISHHIMDFQIITDDPLRVALLIFE